MRKALVVLVLIVSSAVWAKDEEPLSGTCLAVYPGGQACYSLLGYNMVVKGCFSYLESDKLSMKEIKTYYRKKDLEKMEKQGVRIVVVTPDAVGSCKK